EFSDASAAWKDFSQSAYFFLNSASLTPFAGETRVTQSPTIRSSLPSPFTSATQTRVACVGPVRSASRRGWPGLTAGPGLIRGLKGSRSGSLPLPALLRAQYTPPSLQPLTRSRLPSPSRSMTNGSLCTPLIRSGAPPALINSGFGRNFPLPFPLNQ